MRFACTNKLRFGFELGQAATARHQHAFNGADGTAGSIGFTNAAGVTGAAVATGATGPRGSQGATGVMGATGAVGGGRCDGSGWRQFCIGQQRSSPSARPDLSKSQTGFFGKRRTLQPGSASPCRPAYFGGGKTQARKRLGSSFPGGYRAKPVKT